MGVFMKKRLLYFCFLIVLVLLGLALLSSCDNGIVEAENVDSGGVKTEGVTKAGFKYYVMENEEIHIVDYLGNARNIEFPSEIVKKPVVLVSLSSKKNSNSTVTSVTIPSGVKTIGHSAFENFSSLRTVEIADTVYEIGNSAFSNCVNLKEVDLSNILVIGYEAFAGCRLLEDVTLPDDIKKIDFDAFKNTLWVENFESDYVVVGDGVLVNIKPSQTKELIIPDNVKSIRTTLDSDNEVESIYLPQGLTDYGSIFDNLNKLESISAHEENTYFSCQDGVLFNKEKTYLRQYPKNKQGETYVIPEGTIFSTSRFSKNVKNVIFPKSFVLDETVISQALSEPSFASGTNSFDHQMVAIAFFLFNENQEKLYFQAQAPENAEQIEQWINNKYPNITDIVWGYQEG